jgi:hypothetical protein
VCPAINKSLRKLFVLILLANEGDVCFHAEGT